jgi:DNA-binding transcriptional LysR family regulator
MQGTEPGASSTATRQFPFIRGVGSRQTTVTALAAAAVAGLGVAALPDFLTENHLACGALVPVMTRYPPPEAGIFVVRPPGQHPARKIRVLAELLIEHFG